MSLSQSEDVFVERNFEGHDKNGNTVAVRLIMGKPQPIDSNRWRCSFRITGIGHEEVRTADGVDSLDALLMSLRMTHSLLEFFSKQERRKITWMNGDDLGLLPKVE